MSGKRSRNKMSRKRRWHQWQDDFPKLNPKRSPREVVDTENEEAWEFERQLSAELLSVLSSPADTWRYETACRDVRSALHRFVRVPFHLHQFGSSATGLAFNGSDIDLCLELLRPNPRPLINAVPAALRAQRGVFTHVMSVKGARVPIVKFRHAPSGISGDVSFSGTLAVRNTTLIRELCAMDARVHPLLALTKRWARAQGVANSDTEFHRLSSYALALMTVFYLQQRGILPPIAAFLARCEPKQFEQGWECGIAPLAWQPRDPAVSLRDLAVGLFTFYAAFPFDADVVCPLLGRPVSRAAFATAEMLPPEMSAYADRIIQPPAPSKQTTNAPSGDQTNGESSEEQSIVERAPPDLGLWLGQLDRLHVTTPPQATADEPNDNPAAAPNAAPAPNPPGTGRRKMPRAARPLAVGLALRNMAMCVQDPFVLDHNVARGQTDKAFARLTKVLAHAADVCCTTSAPALLSALLTPTPATAALGRRTIRRETGEPPLERWYDAAADIARRVLESVLVARVSPLANVTDGWTSLACAVPHDVIQGRAAAVALCKAEAPPCAILSPVQLQAAASARIVRNGAGPIQGTARNGGAKAVRGANSSSLARFVVHFRAASGAVPGLVVEALAEEHDVKAATHWANFYLNGLQRWMPAELKFLAATGPTTSVVGSQNTIEETQNTIEETQNTIEETQDTIKETQNTIQETQNTIQETQITLQETQNTIQETQITLQETQNTIKEPSTEAVLCAKDAQSALMAALLRD